MTTCILLGFGVWGCTLIRQEFDPVLFLPGDSYLRKFLAVHEEQFPSDGWEAEVFMS